MDDMSGLPDPNDPVWDTPQTREEANERFAATEIEIAAALLHHATTGNPKQPEVDNTPEPMASDPNDYLGIKELRETLSIGDTKARHLMRELPSVKIGRGYRVLRSDLDAYLKENGGAKVKWAKRKRQSRVI